MTLADIIKDHPESVSLFDSRNLDYCCKGKRLLKEAFANNPDALSVFESDLNELINNNNNVEAKHYELMPVSELIDLIVGSHHAYIKQNSPLILEHLEKVIAKHGENYPYLIDVKKLFLILTHEMEQHMIQEELILFPRIKNIAENLKNQPDLINNNNIAMLISVMENEHSEVGDLLSKIREKTNDFEIPLSACTTFRLVINELKNFEKDIHLDVHLENNILFPGVINIIK